MAKLIIDGVNRNNLDLVHHIPGMAGYFLCHNWISECSCEIEIDSSDLEDAYLSRKVKEMIGEFVIEGFEVSYEE